MSTLFVTNGIVQIICGLLATVWSSPHGTSSIESSIGGGSAASRRNPTIKMVSHMSRVTQGAGESGSMHDTTFFTRGTGEGSSIHHAAFAARCSQPRSFLTV